LRARHERARAWNERIGGHANPAPERKRDYFLARSGDGNELLMEPYCWCGSALEQDYACPECNHQCRVTIIACADPGALSIAQELVRTNVDFRNFEVAMLGV
jgi:hypothetical protein